MRTLLLLLFCFPAFANQSSLNAGGKPLSWSNANIPLSVVTGNGDLTGATVNSIVSQSVSQWNAETPVQIVPTNSSINELRFKSDFSIYGPGVIGVTELTYTSGGSIQQAKIYLNDENYTFRSTPGLYSSGEVYLGDVVTHELGHMLGLSHSEVLDSTMFYAAFPGQSTLGADDKSGVRGKYGSGNGTISGTVRGGSQVGVLGVHVVAFSRKTGEGIGAISDQSGNFTIRGLGLNDSYYLYTGPLRNLSALPGQFANVRNDFCPASYTGGFFDACGKENEGFPQAITLTSASPSLNVGDVTIHCSLKSNEDYNYEKLQSTFDPITIFDYSVDQRPEKAFVGNFLTKNSTSWSNYDNLVIDLSGYTDASASQKYLRLFLIARQFGNLLEYEMVVKMNGATVGTYQISYSGVTQTYTTDLGTLIPLDSTPSHNVFEIAIRARRLSTTLALQTFAELDQFVTSQTLPYLLLSSIEDSSGPLLDTGVLLSDNSSCLDAPFTYAVSNARTLASGSELAQEDSGPQGPVSCGTTGATPPGPGGPGAALVGLGFFLAVVLSSLRKTAKNFLS